MPRLAILIRGINVGTKNSLPMATLRAMLADLGCTDVHTYVQSGNAVVATTRTAAALTATIEHALTAHMGRPIAVIVRTAAELRAVVAANPFAAVATDPAKLCVTFLARAPSAAELAPLHDHDWTPERVHAAGKHLYTWHPAGQGQSRLAIALDKLRLRGATTRRNWNTVTSLVELLDGT